MNDPAPASSRHVYRQVSPQVTGWLFVGLAAVLLLLALRSWGDHPAPVLVVWLVLGAALSWVVLLRPCVVLEVDGITFCNLVRDVHLPWNQVDVIEPRWNLRIYTPEDHGYTAWAISSQVARPSRPGGGMGLPGFGGMGRAARASASAAGETPGPKPGKRVTAATVGDDIRKAQFELEEAVDEGRLPAPQGNVTTRWCWPAVAALVVTVVAVVLVMTL